MITRELFWNLNASAITLFYVIGISAILVFVAGCLRHISKYRRGRPLLDKPDYWQGLRNLVKDLATHRTLRRRDRWAGIAHGGIFFGFLGGAIGTAIITLEYDILYPAFGLRFWNGDFYLIFSLILDLGGAAILFGVLFMMWRRAALKLMKLDYLRSYCGELDLRPSAKAWKREDWFFMIFLLAVVVSGFTEEAVRLYVDQPEWAHWSPVGWLLAQILDSMELSVETATSIRSVNWWLHGVAGLGFTAAIPWYKAKHIISSTGSLLVRDSRALSRLPMEEGDGQLGVNSIDQFNWKELLHLDACTKCGRCHEVCPARTIGSPLSPRDLILDLREHNDACQTRPDRLVSLTQGVINPETIWACRTCGACKEICPVGIEHPTLIVKMRRHLVEQGETDPMIQSVLETISNTGNSFGESARKRGHWTRELEFPIKDIRKQAADVLWFVGDYASYDPRNQKVSQTVARLLRAAKMDFGLLYEDEKTAGNDVRRIGEEGLFESLVEHNSDAMSGVKFSSILTTDPHSFNTLKNEYPQFQETAPVEHYSAVLRDLLASGRLKVVKRLGRKVTFHDPCHLGRLNGEYDAPRAVLRAIGCEIIEMPRNRDNSFCCGAGGGRIWLPDTPGKEKPSENRINEAATLDIDVFVTCCPKDLTMFEDARKTAGHEDHFEVADLAELVAEAVALDSLDLGAVPEVIERLTDAIATKVADALVDKIAESISARLEGMELATSPQALPPSEEKNPRQSVKADGVSVAWQAVPLQALKIPDYERPEKPGVRILVAIKHVGKLGEEFEISPDNLSVPDEYKDFLLNEFDDNALEQALLMAEAIDGAEVVAVTIGPEEAEVTLRKVMAKGADRGIRIWNENLEGADSMTLARILAGVSEQENPDLILTGVQSGDIANSATGTALAGILGLPHSAVIVGTEWDGSDRMTVTRELEGGLQEVFEMSAKSVLTVQVGANTPRFASMRMIKQAKKKPLIVIEEVEVPKTSTGMQVRRVYVPPQTRAQMIEGSADEVATKIGQIIRANSGA